MISAARTTVIGVSILVSVVAGASAFYGYVKTVGADDDDVLYLYTSGLVVRAPRQYRHLSNVFLEAERRVGYEAQSQYRLELRRDYINNYILPSTVYSIVDRLIDRFARDHDLPSADPASTERSGLYPFQLLFGFTATFALCFISVLWIVARQNDWRLALAMAATLSLLAFYALKPEGGDHRFVYLWFEAPDQLLANVEAVFQNPRWYSFLHFTPRSNFALLAVGVFVLRWNRHLAGSYWLLLIVALVHQSNGLMLTGLLILIDSVSNPALMRPSSLIPATITLVASTLRDSVWPRFLLLPTYSLIGITCVGVAAALFLIRAVRVRPAPSWLQTLRRIRSRVDAADRVVVDLLLLTVSWLLLFGICAIAYRHATQDQNIYFFQQANSRLLAILQPVLVLGVLLAMLRLWRPRSQILKAVPVAVILVAATVGAVADARAALQIKEQLVTGMRKRFPVYEQQMRTPPLSLKTRLDQGEVENILYYSLARSLDSGIDFISPLVK